MASRHRATPWTSRYRVSFLIHTHSLCLLSLVPSGSATQRVLRRPTDIESLLPSVRSPLLLTPPQPPPTHPPPYIANLHIHEITRSLCPN